MPEEQWRGIADAPGYEVSDRGAVRTWWRRGHYVDGELEMVIGDRPRLIKPSRGNGYLHVNIGRRSLGERFVKNVHRLVLEAFVGPRPEGLQCRHLDGNGENNALENLQWGTREENAADKKTHGRRHGPLGSGHGNAKLTEEKARTVLRLLALPDDQRPKQAEIAAMVGVGHATVSAIKQGKRWAHVR